MPTTVERRFVVKRDPATGEETSAPVVGYAHCTNPRCRGNDQEAVNAVEVETSYSFQDTGGDGMFSHPERTMISLRFADPADSACPHCGRHRDLSAEPRMQLDDSGYDRNALLDITPDKRYDPKTQATVASELRAEEEAKLAAENADLRERLARLEGVLLGQGQSAHIETGPQPQEPPEGEEQ